MDKPLISCNYGLGSSYDDFIEVNYKLTDQLREHVILHEKTHRKGSYTKEDIINDFQSKNSYFTASLKFCAVNPEAWIGFFPLMYCYYKKDWSFNWSSLIPFFWFGLLTSLVFGLIFSWKASLLSFGIYSLIISGLNAGFLIYTHRHVKKEKNFEYKQVYG